MDRCEQYIRISADEALKIPEKGELFTPAHLFWTHFVCHCSQLTDLDDFIIFKQKDIPENANFVRKAVDVPKYVIF